MAVTFHEQFVALFEVHHRRLFRYLHRLTGDRELASDLAQEAFVRLYQRDGMPNAPEAWLVSVALNLFRNESTTRRRRGRLLTPTRGEAAHSDRALPADQQVIHDESAARIRAAVDRMPERERHMLLLRAEGYSYREIAGALEINEASVGVFLARAKEAFRGHFEALADASH